MVIEPDRTRIGLPVAGPARNPAVPLPPAALPGSLELGDRLVQFTVAGVSVALTDTTLTLSDGQGTVVLNAGGITMTGANQETATLAAGNITFNARAANSQINLDSRQINLRAGQNATTPTAQFTLTQIAGGTAELQGTRILLG